ncbi:MAG: polyribonucleotide nucleotidyltransferase [Candidatus Puniceispirillum sp.]|nr:polyribonucleotide nucleotidyltransferase [Candidatus Pelagibacter sp.]MBA4283142.1 polyribonucleotide nucleotidyltransferase [Candidatus Puniceispirillum sp.]
MEFFKIHSQTIDFAGKPLTIETGKMARQAEGAVVVRYGETVVLCTVAAVKQANANAGFFPLSVHYIEKAFAIGKIPGGFFKREGKPSEKEVLTSRLIDRPIRPLFPEGFKNEVQVVCTVLSYDSDADSDIASIIGASAALSLSGIPFQGPLSAARVGYVDGQLILQPTHEQLAQSKLDLVVAGTKDGVLMVESEASELSEEIMLDAVVFGSKSFAAVIEAIEKLKKDAGKDAWALKPENTIKVEIQQTIQKEFGGAIDSAYTIQTKQDRYIALDSLQEKILEKMLASYPDQESLILTAYEDVKYHALRSAILDKSQRVDGRKLDQIRPIVCEVGVLPKAHGSALFTRGETQALVVTTLGTGQDEQTIDSLDGEFKERFMLHYNFPPYSVGECGRMSGPGRREIGHGKLAWRSLNSMVPSKEAFPYVLRTVSEVTESNGSSSMATVCGASLSMMDAGVPLVSPIAGIAMGLVKEGDKFAILSDILGDEDYLGDMDFKVAGSAKGITALQMDIKITSITPEIMKQALSQAQKGRVHILGEMAKALDASRAELNKNAPKMTTFIINKDKIRDVIGSGGKVIREICETTGAKVEIEDTGAVTVSAPNHEKMQKAVDIIMGIAGDPEIGAIYTGTVVKIAEFGAFVTFMPSRDGLVHISELASQRVAKVTDVVNVGDVIKVKVLEVDERGKVKLSLKRAMEEQATETPAE